jgi:hypothetical protein
MSKLVATLPRELKSIDPPPAANAECQMTEISTPTTTRMGNKKIRIRREDIARSFAGCRNSGGSMIRQRMLHGNRFSCQQLAVILASVLLRSIPHEKNFFKFVGTCLGIV